MDIKKNEEISLIQLIVIPLKYWKILIISFVLIFAAGSIVFIANKKNTQLKSSSVETITNEVDKGYIWVKNVNNDLLREYYNYSIDDILISLFNEGNLASKFSAWPDLKCQRSDNMILFLNKDWKILQIMVLPDNSRNKIMFVTEIIKSEKADSRPKSIGIEDIYKINMIVVETFLKVANIPINNYKNLRRLLTKSTDILKNRDIKTMEELKSTAKIAETFLLYSNIEKDYVQTSSNVLNAPLFDTGMPLRKFLILYFLFSIFMSLIVVYILEFSREANLVLEIKKALRDDKPVKRKKGKTA